MQDGATAHTSTILLDYLNEIFGKEIIFQRYRDVKDCRQSWPALSLDLNPCYYFLWGYMKSAFYRSKPVDMNVLLKHTSRVVKKIIEEINGHVINNLIVQFKPGKQMMARHLENVINYWNDASETNSSFYSNICKNRLFDIFIPFFTEKNLLSLF